MYLCKLFFFFPFRFVLFQFLIEFGRFKFSWVMRSLDWLLACRWWTRPCPTELNRCQTQCSYINCSLFGHTESEIYAKSMKTPFPFSSVALMCASRREYDTYADRTHIQKGIRLVVLPFMLRHVSKANMILSMCRCMAKVNVFVWL